MNKPLKLICLALSVIALGFSLAISQFQPQFIFQEINLKSIQNNIQNIIDHAELEVEHKSWKEENWWVEHYDHCGFDIVVEENDTITTWTSNKIDFTNLQTLKKTGVYKLSSSIFFITRKTIENQNIYILIPLKKDFEFENSFLQNAFFPNIDIPNNFLPVNYETPYKIRVSTHTEKADLFFEKNQEPLIIPFWEYFLLLTYFLGIIFLMISIYQFLISFTILTSLLKMAIWVVAMLLINFIFLDEHLLPFAFNFYLFNPYDFANNYISSLGMLLMYCIWAYVLVYYCLKLWEKQSPVFSFVQSILFQLVSFSIFLTIIYFINNIVTNSTSNFIDFDSVVMRYQDILLLLVFGILLLAYLKILLFIVKRTQPFGIKILLQNIVILYAPLGILLGSFEWHLIFLPIFVSLILLFSGIKTGPFISQGTIKLLQIFVGSIFIVGFVNFIAVNKELNNKLLRLDNFQTENNRLAEYLLNELDQKLKNDSSLLGLVYRLPSTEEDIYKYIKMQYFNGFWSQYQAEITICGSGNVFEAPNDLESCNIFFSKKMDEATNQIGNSHFIAIKDYGIDHYLGKFHYLIDRDSTLIDLYIFLKPIEQHKNLGYPSILLTKEIDQQNEERYYSFAKYINGLLVNQTGPYNYALNFAFPSNIKEQELVNKNNYNHLIDKQDDNTINIISSKEQDVWDFFIILSYVFILYVLVFYLVDFLYQSVQLQFNWRLTLKDKLRISFISVLSLSFVAIAISIIIKSTELSENKTEKVLEEKLQSVLVELKQKLIGTEFSKFNPDYLTFLLTKFSNVFFTDINLYHISGQLVASSRPEVFEKGLIGNRMNPEAFYVIDSKKKSYYIHRERIGELVYLSAYIPLKDEKNVSVAYLNLPYFAQEKQVRSEISTLITAFLNIFVLLFLITGLFTIFISNRITLPLSIIQEKLKNFRLEQKNETIQYSSHDEIGGLVKEYNRTVEELNKNIALLAQKEREGAWKEMAKQIAHEIKNPLTPMKLSIQHLKYVWKDNHPNKDKKLNDTIDMVVKQIDQLAEIASAFSDFSKMTTAQPVRFNIVEILNDQVELFSQETNIKIKNSEDEVIQAFADERQISRVFQNLISNAIQAIPEDRNGEITVKVWEERSQIFIEINDNGKGMDEDTQTHLFEPNFTTKNSGMGLGLAIVKQIIENNSGDISFSTEENIGTCFKVSLPKA